MLKNRKISLLNIILIIAIIELCFAIARILAVNNQLGVRATGPIHEIISNEA
jgi:hypothetical protein